MAFDIAPYSGAISSVSDLLTGVMKRIWPEKASEIDRLKVEQATTEFLLTQEGQRAMAEFADRASARALAEKDVEKGNALSNFLAATVRPVWCYCALIVVAYPYLAGAMGWPAVSLDQSTKDIVTTVIMFYFGGRSLEKVLPQIMGKDKGK